MKPEEILKSINVALAERLASPLLASFCISWCLWNYKFIVILLSNNSTTATFGLIEKICFPDGWFIFKSILYPLLTALAYIYIYPFPAKYVYEFHRKKQKELHDLKNKYDDEMLISAEQARQLRMKVREVSEEYAKELSAKDLEISDLKAELEKIGKATIQESTSTKNIDEPDELIVAAQTPPSNVLTSYQAEILKFIAESSKPIGASDCMSLSDRSKIEVRYDIDKLVDRSFIQFLSGTGGYGATSQGRAYLVDNKLL